MRKSKICPNDMKSCYDCSFLGLASTMKQLHDNAVINLHKFYCKLYKDIINLKHKKIVMICKDIKLITDQLAIAFKGLDLFLIEPQTKTLSKFKLFQECQSVWLRICDCETKKDAEDVFKALDNAIILLDASLVCKNTKQLAAILSKMNPEIVKLVSIQNSSIDKAGIKSLSSAMMSLDKALLTLPSDIDNCTVVLRMLRETLM